MLWARWIRSAVLLDRLAGTLDPVRDRAVGQPGRGPRQHEPSQHVGLEVGKLLGRRRSSMLAQITYDGQSLPTPPRLHQQ